MRSLIRPAGQGNIVKMKSLIWKGKLGEGMGRGEMLQRCGEVLRKIVIQNNEQDLWLQVSE